ncbi:MAG: alpha-L-fucosidase [Bacteroidales bacterium]
MKKQLSFSIGILLLFAISSFSVISCSSDIGVKGFNTLNKVYAKAIHLLSNVSTDEQMDRVAEELVAMEKKYKENKSMQFVLALTPETCPENLKPLYEEALKLQSDLKDAGKRLAMSGFLQGGARGLAYKNFTDMLKLQEMSEGAQAHEGAPKESKEERDARMQWWRDGKFGMFIHYGLYAGLAGEVEGKVYDGCVEWIQERAELSSEKYASLAMDKFTPKSGNAEEWVKLAKEAGCVYTVLTSRHHDGFNMFNTQHSDFNVVKTKGIDVIDEYSKACKKHGIKVGYYLSLLDWHHPDYDPTNSGISYPNGNYDEEKAGKRVFGNHERYKEYLYNITDDLLSRYPVDLIWWDFSQPKFQGDQAWGATRLMRNLFDKNPRAIQNNRLYHSDNHLSEGGIKVTPTWKGDYSTAEHHIPSTGIDGDWEACQTLNGTWGYSATNTKWKSSEVLIRDLVDAVSRGGNFLLNIGPASDGSIPAESIRLFKEIGAWMKINGEAIYGTRANPFPVDLDWGRVTRKGDNVFYIFVYKKPKNNLLSLPCVFDGEVVATLLNGEQVIPVQQNKSSKVSTFDVRNMTIEPAATVIKVVGKRI